MVLFFYSSGWTTSFYNLPFYNFNRFKVIIITFLIILIYLSFSILPVTYNYLLNLNLGKHSMNITKDIALGLEGIGFNNKYLTYLNEVKYDSKKLNDYSISIIQQRLQDLSNIETLSAFISEKFRYTVTDQDFDGFNFMMPNTFSVSLDEFSKDNSLRFGRGGFDTYPTNALGQALYDKFYTIRNFEKIYLFLILNLSIIGFFKHIKSKNELRTLIKLFVIGLTLILMIMETQPRYFFYGMIMWILYASITIESSDNR
jgi:hypothetical protein